MGKLILVNRPGIQVVCGKITEIHESKGTIVIEGTVGRTKKHLLVHSKTVKSMNASVGDNVVASIRPTESTVALADGAKLAEDPLEVWSYYTRFSGAFDFEAIADNKEQHIFCGNVENKKKLSNGGMRFDITWNKNGKEERRSLYSPCELRLTKKAVCITGAGHKDENGVTYVVTGVQNLI